ncbi:Uncharacterized protein FWK35_00023361 [Aphis craccivora]|uniref:Uncharacterized protein n=1 Tax=Aphis craccivora TaxID=307492 RepID=A0A6G0YP81_APHCR|nr:Uncharacterized protein FWK35_00023361 [Aphis craccivora]
MLQFQTLRLVSDGKVNILGALQRLKSHMLGALTKICHRERHCEVASFVKRTSLVMIHYKGESHQKLQSLNSNTISVGIIGMISNRRFFAHKFSVQNCSFDQWCTDGGPFLQCPVKVYGHLTGGILPVIKSVISRLALTNTLPDITVAANEYVENVFHRMTNYVSVLKCVVTAIINQITKRRRDRHAKKNLSHSLSQTRYSSFGS